MEHQKMLTNMFKRGGLGAALSVVVYAGGILVLAAMAQKGSIQISTLSILLPCCAALSVLLGGMVAKSSGTGREASACAGAIFFVVVLLVGFMATDTCDINRAGILALAVLCGVVLSILPGKKRRNAKRRARRGRR